MAEVAAAAKTRVLGEVAQAREQLGGLGCEHLRAVDQLSERLDVLEEALAAARGRSGSGPLRSWAAGAGEWPWSARPRRGPRAWRPR